MKRDESFDAALEDALMQLPRRGRSPRGRILAVASIATGAITIFGAGAATAQMMATPGVDEVQQISQLSVATGTGSETVELASAPTNTNSLEMKVECLSAGSLSLPNGSGMTCMAGDSSQHSITWAANERTFRVIAAPNMQWRLSYDYSIRKLTPLASNNAGLTYGADSESSKPDLIAAIATNGREGYILREDLDAAMGCGSPKSPTEAVKCSANSADTTIPVYTSDGKTKIGSYTIQS